MDTVLNTVDDVKHKLTDAEYKALMDGLMEVHKAQPSSLDNFLKRCKKVIGEGEPGAPSAAEFAGAITGTGIDARLDEIAFELEMFQGVWEDLQKTEGDLGRAQREIQKTKSEFEKTKRDLDTTKLELKKIKKQIGYQPLSSRAVSCEFNYEAITHLRHTSD